MLSVSYTILFLITFCALLIRASSILQEKEDRSFYAWEALRDIFSSTPTFTLLGPLLGLAVILSPLLIYGRLIQAHC